MDLTFALMLLLLTITGVNLFVSFGTLMVVKATLKVVTAQAVLFAQINMSGMDKMSQLVDQYTPEVAKDDAD